MSKPLYEKKLFSWIHAGIFIIVAGSLLSLILHQAAVGPWGDNPASNETLFVLLLVMVAIGVNFSRLSITINSKGLTVGYGILKKAIAWQKMVSSYQDETSAIMYGGWGIRLGRVAGKWRLVYNMLGRPRVVIVLQEGWYNEFVFSTQNPKEVIEILEQQLQTK